MFKLFVLVFCLATVASVLAAPAPEYTTKYDNLNIDEILKNERLFSNYYKCLMDQGPCSPDGVELRKVLPDALKTECSSCSEKQKINSEKIFKFLLQNRPEEYADLELKYDTAGVYRKRFNNGH